MKINIERRLTTVLEAHFDPQWGSPFWLNRAKELGFDPRKKVKSMDDIHLLGSVPREMLTHSPVTELLPKVYHDDLSSYVTAETGGTIGPPARTIYSQEEYHEAFIAPFLSAAHQVQFPRDENWLYIGPSGPHIIGKAARVCAQAMGSIDPFSVDFDPRWIRKLIPSSMAHSRYFEHVLSQAEAILTTQDIGVLFTTPPVLEALATRLSSNLREHIQGIHWGGMVASENFWLKLTSEWYPNAIALGGYGNSLAGMCPQQAVKEELKPIYVPHGDRLVLQIHNANNQGLGQVIFHRLDISSFLPNMVERDYATAYTPHSVADGFQQQGILNPKTTIDTVEHPVGALY